MKQILLLFTVILGVLLAGSRLGGVARASQPGQRPVATVRQPSPAIAPRLVAGVVSFEVASPPGTPLLEQQARLEVRRRLSFSIRHTYLDSMLVTPDSTLRRWPSREGAPLRVAIERPPEHPEPDRLVAAVASALTAWDRSELGIRFTVVADVAGADIVISWIDQFPVAAGAAADGARQTGLTSLVTSRGGEIQTAKVQLALGDGREHQLNDDEIRLVAIHEIGHALGLPHSGDRGDIMYPTVLASELSNRDRATLTLLYTLPPGNVREPSSP